MLKDEIKAIIGNRRRFLLLRVADVDVETARKLCNVKKGTYNSWLRDGIFVELYRRREEFSSEYKQEAIQLLRRNNQLNAVLLEEMILHKMKLEVETGEYSLIRTLLARDVYNKLIADLDITPQVMIQTWEQRIAGLFLPKPEQEVMDAPIVETESLQLTEPPKS